MEVFPNTWFLPIRLYITHIFRTLRGFQMMLDAELEGLTDFRDDFDELDDEEVEVAAPVENTCKAPNQPTEMAATGEQTLKKSNTKGNSKRKRSSTPRKVVSGRVFTPFPLNTCDRFNWYSGLWKDECAANIIMEDERLAMLGRKKIKRKIREALEADQAHDEEKK